MLEMQMCRLTICSFLMEGGGVYLRIFLPEYGLRIFTDLPLISLHMERPWPLQLEIYGLYAP